MKLLIALVVDLLLFAITVQSVRFDPIGSFASLDIDCLPLSTSRPDHYGELPVPQPINWGGVSIQFSRHHVIPVSVLRQFANAVFDFDVPHDLRNLIDFNIDYLVSFYSTNQVSNVFPNLPNARNQALSQLSISDRVSIMVHSIFLWMPGNIFFGPLPSSRSDDPHDSFEINSETILGNVRFSRLFRLYNMMSTFISSINCRTTDLFTEIINLLNIVLREDPIPFDQSKWEKNGNKFNIKLQNPRQNHPHRPIRSVEYCSVSISSNISEMTKSVESDSQINSPPTDGGERFCFSKIIRDNLSKRYFNVLF